jgi:chromosome segregation ATPase
MDNKLIAALVIAVIGVGTGIVGIVMANDAKNQNEKTQKALKVAIASENRGVAAQEAQAAKGLNKLGRQIEGEASKANKQVEGEVATAEQQIKSEGQKSTSQLGSLQSSVNSLSDQLSSFEASQKATNQKINARITALTQRVNAMGG